jgi:hypothetical protein
VLPQRRTWAAFESHFEEAGLTDLVAYNKKKLYEVYCQVSGSTVEPVKRIVFVLSRSAAHGQHGLAGCEVTHNVPTPTFTRCCFRAVTALTACLMAAVACPLLLAPLLCSFAPRLHPFTHPPSPSIPPFPPFLLLPPLQELGEIVQGMVADDPPASPAEVVAEVKAKKAEWGLEDADVSKVGMVQSG